MNKGTVFIVDDDEAMRQSLQWLIESVDLPVQCYESAEQFLQDYDSQQAGCLLLDVRMPGMSGLELQEYLQEQGIQIPVIIITGHGDVPMSVRAMKKGAVDFIEKPFNDEILLEAIRKALILDQQRREEQRIYQSIVDRYSLLTPREKEVMDMVTQGHSNKEAAQALGVSAKTIEAHRAKVMDKMQAHSLAELVHMSILLKKSN